LALKVNTTAGEAECILPDEPVEWFYHPTDPDVDIAVTGFVPEPESDIVAIPFESLLTPEKIKTLDIGVGDEVFFPGLFWYAPGNRKNTPIMRMGNLAMFPVDPIVVEHGTMEAYLIEARSIGGISGSPVFVKQTITRQIKEKDGTPQQVQLSSHFHLLGLMHGHWDIRESEINSAHLVNSKRGVNLGIALVVPAQKIIETLYHPDLVAGRERAELELRRKISPTPD
jgi:hypothetical protein